MKNNETSNLLSVGRIAYNPLVMDYLLNRGEWSKEVVNRTVKKKRKH